MRTSTLSVDDVLEGYDAVSRLYPYIPSLSHWRAWEYAAYQNYMLHGRVLDLGCGDGRYFRLIWPLVENVVGIELDRRVAQLAAQSGTYLEVHVTPAHQIPERDGSFDHVFANCSLEHMDHLDGVLDEIRRCLKPGGTLLCSVVTDRFVEWSLLPMLLNEAGFGDAAAALQKKFIDYHHLANPLSVEHLPILPRHNGGIFLLIDCLWHVRRAVGGEMGDVIFPLLSANPRFPGGFRKVLAGLLEMETDPFDSCGAVFHVRNSDK